MYKRVTALLLAICLILTAAPTWVGAADTQAVSVGTASVYPGNSTYVTLRAENFQNIASLEVYLYYDPSVLTVSSTSNGSLLSGSQTSVNTAEAGKIKLVTMALDGINGSGKLLTVYFRAAAGCQPGSYPIEVAIGGAYDSNLAAVNVSSTNGSITVLQQSQSETFSIYANYSKSTLQKGDVQQFRVCSNSSSRKFASADFTVTYDPEVFQFEDAVLGSALTGEGAVYSVNSSVLGQVRITYASSVPVSASYLFYVNLKVIADTNGSTQIKATANNVYKEDLSAYLPGSCSYSFTLKKLPEVVDHPNAFLQTQQLEVGKQCTSRFLLEAGAGVAAADFALTYDPAVLRCVSVAAAEELGNLGGMVIINDNYAEGKLRFSYINMNAYSETEVPIITVTWEPLQSPGTHYQITGSGVGVVDAQQKAVTLEYVTDTGCIYQPTVTPPTCLEDGCTTYACNACGDSYSVDPVEKLGHDITCYEAKEVTCTTVGWNAYETCSRCDYTTYVEIPALGHEEIVHEAQVQTCTGVGWESYVTCSRCDYTTYEEIPALGHAEVSHSAQAATCTKVGWEAYVTCSRCDYSTYQQLPALGHDLISHEGKAPTCLEAGWKPYETCSRCDYTNYQEIPALGHDEILHNAKGATCTEIGWNAYETCSRCDYSTYKELPALGHAEVSHSARAATCTAVGWEAYETCSRCDYSTYKEIPALGHDEVSHSAQAATCTKVGWKAYVTCSRCDYSTYQQLPALGHDLISHEGKEATGQENGWEPYVTCSRCDYSTYKEIPALGHDLISHEGKAPTCLEAGWEPYVTCSRCGYSNYKELPALGHDEVSHSAQAATCTAVGWEAYETCSRCDYSTYKEIPALGHAWTAMVETDETLRAEGKNCTQAHTYWNSCAHCQAVSDTLYFTGTATGPHSFTEQVKDDAHRVPGDPDRYYYDCVHCDTMGQETFGDQLRGDMDNDGDVDVDDAVYLLQHILMPGLFPIAQSGDISADGQSDVDDAIYLLQHVLMPGLFPLQ